MQARIATCAPHRCFAALRLSSKRIARRLEQQQPAANKPLTQHAKCLRRIAGTLQDGRTTCLTWAAISTGTASSSSSSHAGRQQVLLLSNAC
jgi:hypothetical protein